MERDQKKKKLTKKKRGGQRGKGCGGPHNKKNKYGSLSRGKRGGSSAFLARSAYAVGPSNTSDGSWCGSSRSHFSAFADPKYYVPNSVLAKGYATPQLAGLSGKFCGK